MAEEIDIEADKGARKYYEQSERDRPDKETVDRTLQWMEDDEKANLLSGIDALTSVGKPTAAIGSPLSIRKNNQRKISQVSPNMDDPAIASVTKEASAPSRLSADGAYSDMTFGSKVRRTYLRDADGHKAGDQVWFDVNADGSMVECKEAPDAEKAAQNGGMRSKVVAQRTAVPDPSAIRKNNQRKISQVSPYVTDPAIAGITKEASAPSVTSDDGTTRTQYGAYTRVTDRDGNVSWEQDGKKVDAPESMKFMSRFAMERDRKEMGLADDGGDGVASLDSVRGYELYNRMSKQNRAKKRAEYNKNIARTLAGALDAAARSDKVTVDDGVSYKEGVVEKKLLEETNRMLSSVGQHTIKGIMVRQRVNPNDPSQPLGDPIFTIEYNKDGARRSGGDVVSRTFNRGQVEDRIRKAFSVSGKAADGEDLIKKLFRDRAGEIKAEKDAAAKKEAEKVKLEEDKRRWENEQQRKWAETRTKVLEVIVSRGDKSKPLSIDSLYKDIVTNKDALNYFSNVQQTDENGMPVTHTEIDANGNEIQVPTMRRLSPEELKENIGKVFNSLTPTERSMGREYTADDYIAYVMNGGQSARPAQVPVPEQTQTAARQNGEPSMEELLAERAKRNAAQQAQNNGRPAATPAPTEAAVATPEATVVAEPTQVQPEPTQVTVNPELASAVPTSPVEGIVDWYENRRGQNSAEIARQQAEDERRRTQNSPEAQRAMEISRQQKVAHEYLRGKTLQDVTREVASDVASSRGIVLRGNPETWPADVRAQIEREVGSIYSDANEDAFFDKNRGNMYSDFNPRTGQMLYNRGASPVISERRKHIDENQELRRQHIEYIKARDAGNVSPAGDYPMLRDDQNDVEDPEYMRGIKEQSDNFLKSLKGKTPAAQKKAVAEEMKRIDGFDLGDSLKKLLKGSLAYEFMQFISGNESEY